MSLIYDDISAKCENEDLRLAKLNPDTNGPVRIAPGFDIDIDLNALAGGDAPGTEPCRGTAATREHMANHRRFRSMILDMIDKWYGFMRVLRFEWSHLEILKCRDRLDRGDSPRADWWVSRRID